MLKLSLLPVAFLIALCSCGGVEGYSRKWPVEINNSEVKNFYHCVYIFFICTDYVGDWPANRDTCLAYYNRCTQFLDKQRPEPTQPPTDDGDTTTTTESTTTTTTTTAEPNETSTEPGEGETEAPPDDTVRGASSCQELLQEGNKSDGLYTLYLGDEEKTVYCDMTTRGGGWTVIQRRGDYGNPEDYFLRNWTEYKNGFGDPTQEHWLGLEAIHHLVPDENGREGAFQLLITLEDFDDNSTTLIVNNFTITNEENGYAISYKNYNSRIGNSLPARATKFSTMDKDNDMWKENCAVRFKGAWWYSACHNSNLNGLYLRGPHEEFGIGVNWFHWKGYKYSLKSTEMKVRPRPGQRTQRYIS